MLCSDVVKEKWHRGRELRGAETTLFWVKSSEKALKKMLHLRRLTLNQAVDSKEKMGEQTNSKVRKSPVLGAYRRGLEGEEKERMERALKNLLYFIILIFWGISPHLYHFYPILSTSQFLACPLYFFSTLWSFL